MGEIDDLYKNLAELMDREVSDEEVQSLVHQWRMLISKISTNVVLRYLKGLQICIFMMKGLLRI